MKKTYFNLGLAAFLTAGVMMFSGCSQDELLTEESVKEETGELNADGTFTATFIPSMYEPMTRAKVEGLSTAVQSLKYLIYKDNGHGQYCYYTERDVFGADATVGSAESYQWPYAGKIQVDLPGGNYKVAFVGNANPKLFGEGCNELLSYTADESGKWEDVRLNMPNIPFSDNNMFYMDAVEVSAKNPVAQVWLERKVCKAQLWRETVASDNGQILTLLLENVLDHLNAEDPVTGLIGGQVGKALKRVFDDLLVLPGHEGLVPALEDILLEPLIGGLTQAVRPLVVEGLAPLLDDALKENNKGALLQQLTNPWAIAEHGAVVTFTHVPNALDLEGKVASFYPEGTKYKYDLKEDGNFRYIDVTGLADAEKEWTIGRVDILKKGLVGGLVVDQIIDSEWFLDGSLIDTNTEGLAYTFGPNYKYKSVYGLATLNVDESVYSGDGTKNLTVVINLGKIANIHDILKGIINGETSNEETPSSGLLDILGPLGDLIGGLVGTVGSILNRLLDFVELDNLIDALVKALTEVPIEITLPINVNALGVDTLEVTGTWGEVTTID